jgi:hypothetical protein
MLQEFVSETKHRPREYETDEDRNHITRKILATIVPKFVDWRQVYPFVDSDLNSINFRAPNALQNYATFKYLEPEWLDNVLSNAKYTSNDTLSHYIDHIQPIPVGKELYMFFLHGQKQKNLSEHLNYLYGKDVNGEKTRMYNAINSYVPIYDEEMMHHDIGTMLQNIECGSCGGGNKTKTTKPEKEKDDDLEDEKMNVENTLAKEWDSSYKNPILETFRASNNLSALYPDQNIIKQLLISSVSPSIATEVLAPIMGKYQHSVHVTDHDPMDVIMYYVDYIPNEQIQSLLNLPQVKSFYNVCKKKPATDRELIKWMIQAHMPKYKHTVPLYGNGVENELDQEMVQLFL